jgi:7-keto-8-aminopelargonate synthetase-like enzyme
MRTEQDKINRREANQRYYKLEENKEQKRNYMKAHRKKKIQEASNEWLHIKNSERFINEA